MYINIFYVIGFSFLLFFFGMITNIFATNKPKPILSPLAISQNGKIAIDSKEDLTLDKETNLQLNEFTAYISPKNSSYKILLGPVFGKDNLEAICQKPEFLLSENILGNLPKTKQKYFNRPYKGCFLKLDDKRTAIVIKHPKPFTDQQGRDVKFVGIVTNTNRIDTTLKNIKYSINGKDLYTNLLQIGNTFSPFTNQINWQQIKREGLRYIGRDEEIGKGLYAAAVYYVPKLYALDHHSFISLDGLGTEKYPKPNVPLDKGMQKWLTVQPELRKRIIGETANFHSKNYGNITYLYIPSIDAYSQDKIDEAVRKGREELKKANVEKSKGIIVDLRCNTGGDTKSMLLTLGGILPKGKIFGLNPKAFVSLTEDGNSLVVDNEIYGKYSGDKPIMAKNKPVVILTNWLTASSAEITALTIKRNIKMSKIFGSNTSGCLSTNQTFFLWNNNSFNLMFEHIYDGQGNVAPLSLTVDREFPDDLNTIFTDKDQTIKAGIDWINSISSRKK